MSTNEVPNDSPDTDQKSNQKPSEEDEELSSLLDSALNDFDKSSIKSKAAAEPERQTPVASGSTANSVPVTQLNDNLNGEPIIDSFDDNMSKNFAKFDEMFTPLINADPELKEHWTKLTQSCAEAAEATSDEDFQNSLRDTLKTISEKAQNVVGQENNMSEEELARIWSNLNIDPEDDPNGGNNFSNLMPLMTNMMQNLLSKDLLYPALSELVEKYPTYLEENKDQLSAEDLKRYTKQMDLMKEVCDEFDSEAPEDSESVKKERFQRILAIMQSMQSCGSPPTQLIGDVPDFTAGLPDLKFPDIPGVGQGQGQQQCLLM